MKEYVQETFPVFLKTCELLKDNLFYRGFLEKCKDIPLNYELAEKLCVDALELCGGDWELYRKKLNSLLEMNVEFLKLQASLEKTGTYRYSTFEEVNREVFAKEKSESDYGVDYLWGLYFSQIFWVTHHRMFNFFLNDFVRTCPPTGRFFDVPIGSGMFAVQFAAANQKWRGVGVDISNTSVDFAKKLLAMNGVDDRVDLSHEDFFTFKSAETFDRIMCIEFIEHVEDPIAVLKKLKKLLSDEGKIFLTTVAWAAHIDHIYLYRNVGEIRDHIAKSGLRVEKEFLQTIFDKDKGRVEDSKIAVNYSAILAKSF